MNAFFFLLLELMFLAAPKTDLPEKLVFVTRHQYAQDHHNTATLFQYGEINSSSFKPGASLVVLNLKTGKSTTLLSTETGLIRDPEVSFSGEKILFSYRKNLEDNYHIYEIDADGKKLKQLTFTKGVSDIDPLYLPNGQIVFSSTREPKYCMCNRHIMANLYRMNPDGSNIIQLGKSTLFEGHTALMDDGRLVYDRWEYIDRNFGDAQGLWTVNPDGTRHAIYYGNNTSSPGGIIDPRPLPGSNLMLCIFGSCHDRPWGALALIDRSRGVDGKDAVVKIWPESALDLVGIGNWDTFMQLDVRYEDPFPVSQTQFLVSKSIHLKKNQGHHPVSEKMGIYLVDMSGNEVLIHEDEHLSCFDPMPLAPRKRPREIPTARRFDGSPGNFYVQDVYEGTHMSGVERGTVKYLRIVESPEKRTYTDAAWLGQGQQAPGVNWHSFETKRILGTVPVEADGSANFLAPSGKYLYFQLLDGDKKMVQSMRSGVIIHPGETNGCIGCHEDRLSAPVNLTRMPMALRKKAHNIATETHREDVFSYMELVQPLFDRHCISCHDFDKPAASSLILAGDRNPYFNASYVDLHVKKQVHCIGGGPAELQEAYSWGSHKSNLVKVLEEGHQGISLTQAEMEILYTWIDLNGVYYAHYESAYPDNPAGRSPLRAVELERLGKLTGIDVAKLNGFERKMGPQISFERPWLSPCLSSVKSKKAYAEALEIIQLGQARLKEMPRADMLGFIPCEEQQVQLKKYDLLLQLEEANQKAIAEGKVKYDYESLDGPE
jgi:hypothetical protein